MQIRVSNWQSCYWWLDTHVRPPTMVPAPKRIQFIFNAVQHNCLFPQMGIDQQNMHGIRALNCSRCMLCTSLVSQLPQFTGVHWLDFIKVLHQQKFTHHDWAFEILIPAAQTCARRLRGHQVQTGLALRRRRNHWRLGEHDSRHRFELANLVPLRKHLTTFWRLNP